MLNLKNITKVYGGEEVVEALKGINIEFRKSEFVSILGPSGCGKTTLLNIIGGLDRYTDGDLIINGKSTKEFKDKDWDAYRNYSVGFVFQSYNLIAHQTVLSNVELALTISGVSKKERREKAIKALDEVGLKSQIHKKPNQLSGGQMQRVAIARALVNDPDIILADEPTGALDSKTSVQIMETLKRISKDKLIIMVTHNGELAEKYSTRIVKILDGQIVDDSKPFSDEDKANEKELKAKDGRTSMKFFTALRLSLNNLMTKKARTFLTAFAGSIGIIGIALILSISTGVQNYINRVEEETLSSYPITIEEMTIDLSSMIETLEDEQTPDNLTHENGKIYSKNIMNEMLTTLSNKVTSNNLPELKKYIDEGKNNIVSNATAVQYQYNLILNLYKEDTTEGIVQVNPSTVMNKIGMGKMMSMNTNVWQELLDNENLVKSQYDLLAGKWPTNYNEVVLIVNGDNELNDYALYSLGLKNQDELKKKMEALQKGEVIDEEESTEYSYEELLNLKFKLLLNSDYYKKENGVWVNKVTDEEYLKEKIKDAEDILVVGIIKPNAQSVAAEMAGGIGYLKELKEYVIKQDSDSEVSEITNSIDLEKPTSINIYPKDFEAKDEITNAIEEYNESQRENGKEENVINYTDIVGVMMKSVNQIINTISYVLIAFVAVSLVVSSIMIGIITYISVLERTKEIGILRAIGASKRDIARVFNAETLIVGLVAGLLGIGLTILLNIPINYLIYKVTGISVNVSLPTAGGTVLVIISVILTMIAGLIPASIASKKDPVIALRTE